MDKFIITGGTKLCGEIEVDSAKNAYLPILAGTILCEDEIILNSCPDFKDIENMCLILKELGIDVKKDKQTLYINAKNADKTVIPTFLAKELRSSFFALGALLSRFKKAKVAYPGGCDIGLRPIDLHIKGLKDLGVKIVESHGYITCDASNMKGGVVHLDYPSVGATENLMMSAVLAKGTTTIVNTAKEPEIVDLQNFLNSMGAKIHGAGTSIIAIEGVERLHKTIYTPIPDRIIAGTYLIACAMTGGKILVKNCIPQHFSSLSNKLQKSGCKIKTFSDKIYIESSGRLKTMGFIETRPYPGFPTDLQAQTLTLQTISKGNCIIQENLFETRFKFVPELIKMGANIKVSGQTAYISGVKNLLGAEVYATDLRGGVALVLAGLHAQGYTTIHNIFHIDRGYANLEEKLSRLGAKIIRESENN